MRSINYTTPILILLCVAAYLISRSLFAGVITGVISFLLIRFYILTLLKIRNIKSLILLINMLKFGIVILMLFIFIRYLRMDAVKIAIGYSMVFLLTITELFIRKPKES
ncbi:MAG: hypothetical protein ACP5QK_07085 [Myxococcota bacterium]